MTAFVRRACLVAIASIVLLAGPAHADAKKLFIDNCAACHGEDARGLKEFGADLVENPFVKQQSDEQLKEFLKMGRQPDAPDNKMKLLMPAFDYMTDEELAQVIAYARNPR